MRIDRQRRFTEDHIEHDICGLAPDTRQRLQRFARAWDLTAMALEQNPRGQHDMPCFGVEQSNRFDIALDPMLAEREHFQWCSDFRKKKFSRLVDADIRRLGRQHHRDQEFIRARIFQLGGRRWMRCRQYAEDGVYLPAYHLTFFSQRRAAP